MAKQRFIFLLLIGFCAYTPAFSQQCMRYPDNDGDGFGAGTGTPGSCTTLPAGFSWNNQDCNDNSPNIREWAPVGGTSVSPGIVVTTQMRVAPDGTPFILYRHYTDPAGTGLISVKKLVGSNWVPVGEDPIAVSDYIFDSDLAIDAAGVPYVSFVDRDQGNRVTVIKYRAIGDTWNVLGTRGFSADPVVQPGTVNIAIDNNNAPHIFYSTLTGEGIVMRYDQVAGTWNNVGNPITPLGSSEYDITCGSDGTPYIVYTDAATKIAVSRFTGGAWQQVGTSGFSDDFVSSPQIALDPHTDQPYVAYIEGSIPGLVVQRYAAGLGDWAKVGAPVYNDYTEFSLAVDGTGSPYVAHGGPGDIIIVEQATPGGNWIPVANVPFTTGLSISLAISRDNVPFVSCKDLVNSDHAVVRSIIPVLSLPTQPTITPGKTGICSGETVRLEVTGGALNDATGWEWYVNACGSSTTLGTSDFVDVSPSTTTTYYARAIGHCAPVGPCGQITVNVTTTPTTPTLAAIKTSVCPGGSTNLSIATGTLGNIATQQWVWYETTCGDVTKRLGSGTPISVTPSVTTTYYARGEGSCTGTCASITIQVSDLPTGTGPATALVCSGSGATLTVTPGPSVTSYQWRVSTGASTWADITNQISATLTRAATDLQTYPTENIYAVVLKNSIGCEQTLTNLKVLSFPQPVIAGAGNPISATICEGASTSFNVSTSSGTNLDYQWQVDNGGGFVNVTNGSGYADATTSNLKINGAGAGLDDYAYRVVVKTLSGGNQVCSAATSAAATLTVNTSPSLNATGQPANATVCSAAAASFQVTSGGTNLTYQWQESTGGSFTDILNTGIYSGATTDNLRIAGAAATMNGYRYRVVVGNTSCTPVTSNATTLAINTPPSIGSGGQPANASLCSGGNATFSVTSSGTNLSYQWQQSSGGAFFDIGNDAVYSDVATSTLRITSAPPALNGRQYRVVVSNTGCSSATSDGAATLEIKSSAVTITQQPAAATTCAGGNMSFEVAATGTDLAYQWQESTGAAFADITDDAVYTGATTGTLNITGTTESLDGHQYRVIVSNQSCGTSATSDGLATLTIATSGISITEDPSDVTICQGNNAVFHIAVAGAGISYQWQESIDGGPFEDLADEGVYSGSTLDALLVTAHTGLQGARYRVIVGNGGCQTLTSGEAELTVSTEPGTAGCPYVLLVSEGLSPNGDNQLDYWVIQGIERYPANRVKVYNVWGDLIFEKNGYVNEVQAWRGESNRGPTIAGSGAPDGTYYYTIDLGDGQGKDSILKGFVLLKR